MRAPPVPLGLTRDERHVYTAHYPPAPPVQLISVTTATDVIAKYFLAPWYAKMAAEWSASNLEQLGRMVQDFGIEGAVKAVGQRAETIRKAKADLGTRVHTVAEYHLSGREIIPDDETRPFLRQLERFERDTAFAPIWVEAMVASPSVGYAGTLDLIGEMTIGGQRRRALLDIKTGAYLDASMGLQLAAYGAAEFIGAPGRTDRWRVPDVDMYAVLHLRPDRYAVVPYDVQPADFLAFQDALSLKRWQQTRDRAGGIQGRPLPISEGVAA